MKKAKSDDESESDEPKAKAPKKAAKKKAETDTDSEEKPKKKAAPKKAAKKSESDSESEEPKKKAAPKKAAKKSESDSESEEPKVKAPKKKPDTKAKAVEPELDAEELQLGQEDFEEENDEEIEIDSKTFKLRNGRMVFNMEGEWVACIEDGEPVWRD